MKRIDHYLFIVAEECAEVAQRASKAARFGMHETQPGADLDNRERLLREFADLCGSLELLLDEPIDNIVRDRRKQIDAKKVRIEEFFARSREFGRLEA